MRSFLRVSPFPAPHRGTAPSRLRVASLLAFAFMLSMSDALPGPGPLPLHAQGISTPELEAAWTEVADFFRAEAERRGVVGGSLWFVRDGAVLGRVLHGMADIERGQRVDESTIFHWASVTKTLTGIGILQLRDRGLLRLEDRAVDWLPELRAVHASEGSVRDMTVAHLLSHTSGFRASTWPWGGDRDWHPFEPTRWEELAAMMPWSELLFPPGERFGYSNPGIVLLARILEEASGEPWEAYVQKWIFHPLGLEGSYFRLTPPHLASRRSNAYRLERGGPVPRGPDFDPGITVSNSGWNAPVPDLVRYLAFLSGALGDTGEGILTRATLEEMWEPRAQVGEGAAWGEPYESMGLTFFLSSHPEGRLVGHAGRQWNHLSFFHLDPDTGAGAIGVVNTDGVAGPGRDLDARAFLREVRERLVQTVFPRVPAGD